MKIFYFICLMGLFAFPAYAEEQTEVNEQSVAAANTRENVVSTEAGDVIVTVTEEGTAATEGENTAEESATEETPAATEETAAETGESKTATEETPAATEGENTAEESATEETSAATEETAAEIGESKTATEAAPAVTESENTAEETATEATPAATESENVVEEAATEAPAANEEAAAEIGEGEAKPAVDLLSETNPEQEKKEIIKTEALPEDFMNNLLTCSPSQAERVFEGVTENIVIIGLASDKCNVNLADFSLSIPFEKLTEISTYEDFENLCEDEDIAVFDYARNYRYANLMSELNQCKEYENIHHNGRSSAAYPYVKTTVVTDMTSQHKDDLCEIIFVNEVVRDGKFTDYSVVCSIPDEKIAEMLQQHRELIDLYGAKKIVNEDGTISSRNSVTNTETYKVDGKLMYDLQVNGYCHLVAENTEEQQ